MKNSYGILLTFGLLLTVSMASKAESFNFLSTEEFEVLAPQDQQYYIEKLQQLSSSFEENQSKFKSAKSKWQSFLEGSLSQQASANTPDDINIRVKSENDTRAENAKISVIINRVQVYLRVHNDIKTPTIKETVVENFQQAYQRLMDVSKKPMDAEQAKNFEANLRNLKKVLPEVESLDSSVGSAKQGLNGIKVSASSRSSTQSQTVASEARDGSDVESSTTAEAAAPKPSSTVKLTASAVAATSTTATSITSAATGVPKCMYSGFIGFDAKCFAPTSLPVDFKLKEITKEKFKCAEGEGKILCNPMVFGYKDSTTGYCVQTSLNASMSCTEKSRNADNMRRLLALWQNPENKIALDEYQKNLTKLCDGNSQKSFDLDKTCRVVKAQFKADLKKNPVIAELQSSRTRTTPVAPVVVKPASPPALGPVRTTN